MDVGCNYVSGETPTVMTFYSFTSTRGGLDAEMKDAIAQMKSRQPVAKEAPFMMPSANNSYRTYTLTYETVDGTKMRTSVLLGQEGRWLLKIRLTCRASDAQEAERVAGLALIGQQDRLRTRPAPPNARPDPI